jgi:hypothetical protein
VRPWAPGSGRHRGLSALFLQAPRNGRRVCAPCRGGGDGRFD